MNQKEQSKQPFFVKFLEAQKETDTQEYSGTKPVLDLEHTMKYPSDGDETYDVS